MNKLTISTRDLLRKIIDNGCMYPKTFENVIIKCEYSDEVGELLKESREDYILKLKQNVT